MPFFFNHILQYNLLQISFIVLSPAREYLTHTGTVKGCNIKTYARLQRQAGIAIPTIIWGPVYMLSSEGLPCFVASDNKPRDYALQIIRMMMKFCNPLPKVEFLFNIHVVEIQIKTFNAVIIIRRVFEFLTVDMK